MKNIMLSKEHIYNGNLILVNEKLPINSLFDINENELVYVNGYISDVKIKREAVNALHLIFEKIGCTDEIIAVSGYRSTQEQIQIYNDSLKENDEDFTRKYVALPNHSEHQTGLAIDLGIKSYSIDFIRPKFTYDGLCNEFRKYAKDFGYIERYPKGKEKITGIAHEPWHFRYVGYPHSAIISENGFTLEEYIDFIKLFSCENSYYFKRNDKIIEVFYVNLNDIKPTEIKLPEYSIYQISGNNSDGFICTLWRNHNGQK